MHLRIYNNQTEITRMRDSGYSEDEGKTPDLFLRTPKVTKNREGRRYIVKSINVHMIAPGECTRQADSRHIDITLLGLILQSPDQLSPFFCREYPTVRGKYPPFVLMVAVVEFDGRMTYWRKDHCLALLCTPLLSVARVCAEIRPFSCSENGRNGSVSG